MAQRPIRNPGARRIDFEKVLKAMLTPLVRMNRLSDALAPLEEGIRTRVIASTNKQPGSSDASTPLSDHESLLACLGICRALGIDNSKVDRYGGSDFRDLYAHAIGQMSVKSPDEVLATSPSLWFALLLAEIDGARFPIGVVDGPQKRSSKKSDSAKPKK